MKQSKKTTLLFLVIFFEVALVLNCSQALAILNVEALRSQYTKPDWYGEASLSFSQYSGNTESESLKSSLHSYVLKKTWDFLALASSKSVKNKESIILKRSLVHVRYGYKIYPLVSTDFFIQQEKDPFRKLSSRDLLGTGLRFEIYRKKEARFFGGIGLFQSIEKLSKSNDLESSEAGVLSKKKFNRWNFFMSYQVPLNKGLFFRGSAYYQPKISDTKDHRGIWETSFSMPLSKDLKLSVVHKINSDSHPPNGVKKKDRSFETVFTYSF